MTGPSILADTFLGGGGLAPTQMETLNKVVIQISVHMPYGGDT